MQKKADFKLALWSALHQEFPDMDFDLDTISKIQKVICQEIESGIKEGRTVSIRGFGTFKPKFYLGNTNSDVFEQGAADINRMKGERFARPSFKSGVILKKNIK